MREGWSRPSAPTESDCVRSASRSWICRPTSRHARTRGGCATAAHSAGSVPSHCRSPSSRSRNSPSMAGAEAEAGEQALDPVGVLGGVAPSARSARGAVGGGPRR